MDARVKVMRSVDRFVTRSAGITSRHCFSFGEHYDAANVRFGRLLALNDESMGPGAGFPAHEHSGIDIVTWVLEGQLEHADSSGLVTAIGADDGAVLRAGGGVSHAERNAGAGVCRFLQSWLTGETSGAGAYERIVASPDASLAAPSVTLTGARLHAGVLAPDSGAALPAAPFVHVFVARGALTLGGAGVLQAGDSARLTAVSGQRVVSGSDGAQVHVWAMDAD